MVKGCVGVWIRGVGRASAACIAFAALIVNLGQPAHAQEATAPQAHVMMSFEHTGCETMFPSAKDQGLSRALHMLPERLKEILAYAQQEGGAPPIPPEMIDTACAALTGPMRMIVTNRGFDQQTGFPLIGVVMSWRFSGEEAEQRVQAVHAQIDGVRQQVPQQVPAAASQKFPGMTALQLPFGVVHYGPRKAADAWRYEIIFGDVTDADAIFEDAFPASPAGLKTVMHGSFDLRAVTPLVRFLGGMAAMAVPNGRQMLEALEERGVIGPEAMSFEFVHGFDDRGGAVSMLTSRRAARFLEGLGAATQPITAADIAVVPADAVVASIEKMDLMAFWERVKAVAPPAADALNEFERQFAEATGLSLTSDLLSTLGTTSVFYISHSTGGNSLLSSVVLVSLADAARFKSSWSKMVGLVNQQAQHIEMGPMAIRLAQFERDGVAYTQFRLLGGPLPLEPTFAVVGHWMVAGATSAACTAAVAQVKSGANSHLGSNPAFKANMWEVPGSGGPSKLFFIDSGATIADGYPAMSLACSALANTVRSPVSDREPGMVLPTLTELKSGAKPVILMVYMQGHDMVIESHSDSSLLVNMAGMLGAGDVAPLLIGGFIGGGVAAKATAEEFEHRLHWERQMRESEDHEEADFELDDEEGEQAEAEEEQESAPM